MGISSPLIKGEIVETVTAGFLSVKLTDVFSEIMKTNVSWTKHSATRLIERFDSKPSNTLANLLNSAIRLLRRIEATKTVVVSGDGERIVVASSYNKFEVLTVIKDPKFTASYEYK